MVKKECQCSFITKANDGATSQQMCKCKYCFMAKMNVGMASIQGQMLARLHGKGSQCGYIAKTLEMAVLKR